VLLASTTSDSYYSVDLTAATDRFPIEFIAQVLSGRLPKDYVSAWRSVMVDYPFKIKQPGDSVGN